MAGRRFVLGLVLAVWVALSAGTEWVEEGGENEDWNTDTEYCMGDMENVLISGKTCPEHVEKHPSSCYNQGIYTACCHSCDIVYLSEDHSRPGCEYGNRDEGMTFTDPDKGDTYTCKDVDAVMSEKCQLEQVSKICCDSCDKWRRLTGQDDSDEESSSEEFYEDSSEFDEGDDDDDDDDK